MAAATVVGCTNAICGVSVPAFFVSSCRGGGHPTASLWDVSDIEQLSDCRSAASFVACAAQCHGEAFQWSHGSRAHSGGVLTMHRVRSACFRKRCWHTVEGRDVRCRTLSFVFPAPDDRTCWWENFNWSTPINGKIWTTRCANTLMHDTASPRRQIGRRCRKWAVSTQQTADKRKSAACFMCGQQFSHGEVRLQQRSNRNSQRAYAHAQCVNGGVAHRPGRSRSCLTSTRSLKQQQTQRSSFLSQRVRI